MQYQRVYHTGMIIPKTASHFSGYKQGNITLPWLHPWLSHTHLWLFPRLYHTAVVKPVFVSLSHGYPKAISHNHGDNQGCVIL